MESAFTHRWIRKFRILTLCLVFSGALNLAALAIAIAVWVQDRNEALFYPASALANAQVAEENSKLLAHYARLSFRELASLLTNTDFVEEGYRKRDLALSAMVANHFFHIEKALGAMPAQKRLLETNGMTFALFPGLTDDQFLALIRFAYLEKWPLTSQGIFLCLQKSANPREASLEQAFLLTPEFYALNALFQKCEPPVAAVDLLDLLSEGSWSMLEGLMLEQSQMLDLSQERRRVLLLSYLALHSPAAARLLLQTDLTFALKRLDDKGILDLLSCIKGAEPKLLETFCVELLKSSRSDVVWHKSAEVLYRCQGEEPPSSFDRGALCARFVKEAVSSPSAAVAAVPAPPRSAPRRNHIVQDGENLWKIARLYKVTVEEIVRLNCLQKEETIFPGMTLQIPTQGFHSPS